jgi:hypothetical protein
MNSLRKTSKSAIHDACDASRLIGGIPRVRACARIHVDDRPKRAQHVL